MFDEIKYQTEQKTQKGRYSQLPINDTTLTSKLLFYFFLITIPFRF